MEMAPSVVHTPGNCPGTPTTDSILTQIIQASDILANGTQDPTKPCSAVTIGLGFQAMLPPSRSGAVLAVEVPRDPFHKLAPHCWRPASHGAQSPSPSVAPVARRMAHAGSASDWFGIVPGATGIKRSCRPSPS